MQYVWMLLTFMYFGQKSMNGLTESVSSFAVMPFRGGTISREGKGFLLSLRMSLIFISYLAVNGR